MFYYSKRKNEKQHDVSKQTQGCIILLSRQHKANNPQINISAVSQIMMEKGDKMCIISERKK